ncbi:frequency clock protein [Xylaria intraflava]|nr:frequency clock protein [Xylaria intraflava]
MADSKSTQASIDPPPVPNVASANPRRTSPANSTTMRHPRLARDGSRQHVLSNVQDANVHSSSSKDQPKALRRDSSREINETGCSEPSSDPRQWFERSNQNLKDTLNTSAMDVDPPYFQKETDSSSGGTQNNVPPQMSAYRHVQNRGPPFRASFVKSNSADDYRSVIDDLTIENKRLREELRKLKQMGPDSLRRDKLFEVKVHGLPSAKKRELEAALRDFTTNLTGLGRGPFTSRKKVLGKSKEAHSSASKHATSSSGSNSRPVDSAYASMGAGESSSSHLPPGQARAGRLRSSQLTEEYLPDIPAGLCPRPFIMADSEKKKLVVKRLEHLFTGKMGHSVDGSMLTRQPDPIAEDIEMEDIPSRVMSSKAKEAAREAKIRTGDTQQKTSRSHTTASASISNARTHAQLQSHSIPQSNADLSNSRDNDKDSGSGGGGSGGGGGGGGRGGKDVIPPDGMQPSEQRPTRPRDLDPDRKQVPADNMEYIRHLGIVAPESQPHFSSLDVSPDAEGWIYLNLLGNLAQLHILNVTTDFIRSAVSEKSTKFQLSPDGRKIRWRGGDEGTRFTSDSGSNSRDRSCDDTDGSNESGQRKRHKGSKFKLDAQDSNSSHSFHYKPLFVHHPTSSPDESGSNGDDSGLSNEQSEESNLWAQSGGSTGLSRRKRRRDGAIIFYSEAPFCTDLSGDYSEASLDTYEMTSAGKQPVQGPAHLHLAHRPYVNRSPSGSSIPFKPLTEPEWYSAMMDLNSTAEPGMADDSDDSIEAHFPWSDSDQLDRLTTLEASGLGGVCPDDHFLVVVSTKRPKSARVNDTGDRNDNGPDGDASLTRGNADAIVEKLASMSTGSPAAGHTATHQVLAIEIEYIADEFRRLSPVTLPPAAFYFRPGDSGSDEIEDLSMSLGEENVCVSSERSILSKRPMLEGSQDSDNRDLSGNDEEDEHSDDVPGLEPNTNKTYGRMRRKSGIKSDDGPSMQPLQGVSTGSSAATAGGAASVDYSSIEEDS